MVTFTRTQLHEAVWSHPLNVIAREHGIPYEAIVRACDLMRISRPRVGYWQKKSVMRGPPPPPPLPEAPGVPDEATLCLRIPRLKRPEEPGEGSKSTTDTDHPLIACTRAALAKAKVDEQGLLSRPSRRKALAIRVSPHQLERAIGIYTQVIDALGSIEAQLEVSRLDKNSSFETWVVVNGERFGLELIEKLAITERKPKPSEEVAARLWGNGVVKVFNPTGRLTLRLLGLEGTRTRQRWADTPTCPLEHKVAGFPVGLVMAVEVVRARREERERWHRENEARARAAEAEQRERLRQDALVRQMLQTFREWKAANELVTFLDEVERVVPAEQRNAAFEEAMGLARMHVQDLDPLESPERAVKLLTQPDEDEWAQEIGLGLERPVRE